MLPKGYTRANYNSSGYAHSNGKFLSNFTRDAKLAAVCRENTRAKVLVVTNSVTGPVGNLKLWRADVNPAFMYCTVLLYVIQHFASYDVQCSTVSKKSYVEAASFSPNPHRRLTRTLAVLYVMRNALVALSGN